MSELSRRDAAKRIARFGAVLAAGGLAAPRGVALAQDDPVLAGRPLVRYPEKTDLILLTSRPPQLETPMKYFDRAITPNEAFFVRYHVFPIPLEVDLSTWRLRITGRVERPLELSLDELKTKFPAAKVVAVNQCSGNSRGRFSPRVLGGQWGDGAMGNAEWVGARMRDILTRGRREAGRATGHLRRARQAGVSQGAGLRQEPGRLADHGRPGRHRGLSDERPAAARAQWISGPAHRAGMVCDLLGQESLRDRGDRPRLREVLDEARLSDPRYALRLRRARHGSCAHGTHHANDGAVVHRCPSAWSASGGGSARHVEGHRLRRRIRDQRSADLR